jgi:cytochrome o ubiquinol oxidase operon protein cyoD
MSSITNTPHQPHTPPESEHGTTTSYIVGFILSLLFTFIPYYLVTEKIVTGNTLVATILVVAVLQMIIQVVFFLHLGREKKPHWQLIFLSLTVGGIILVVGGSIWIMHHLHYNMTPVTPADISKKLIESEGIYQIDGQKTGACHGAHTNHKVVIKDGQVKPSITVAYVCDTLTFVNEYEETLEITFANHPDTGVYAGESKLKLRHARNKTITLSQQGTYQFHDHLHEKAAGEFIVLPPQKDE